MDNSTILDMLLSAKSEMLDTIEAHSEIQLLNFNRKLSDRIDENEKLTFIQTELNRVREVVEKDHINTIYNLFLLPINDFKSLSSKNVKGLPDLLASVTQVDQTDTNNKDLSGLFKMFEGGDVDSLGGLHSMTSQILNLGIEIPFFEQMVDAKNPLKALNAAILAVHYQKKYIKFLIDKLGEIKATEKSTGYLEKIEWLGSQKELAELFVELEKKGWIKEKKVGLIKTYFTKSNTIEQTLKPSQDKFDYKNLYSGIYTNSYTPSFGDIKPNKSKKK